MIRKITTICLLSIAITSAKAQSTIPTTTVNGSLRINDSLNVTNDIHSTGDIITSGNMSAAAVVASGEVTVKDTIRAEKDILIDGNAVIRGKLNVTGSAAFSDAILINKKLQFTNGNEFSFTPATANSNARFYLGNSIYKAVPLPLYCPIPNSNTLPQFINNGAFISHVPFGSGVGETNASLSMYTAPWDGSGVIEVAGSDNTGLGGNGLLINYFCHRNTLINTGWDIPNNIDGGTVFMGAKVDLQRSLKIGWTAGGGVDLNTSIEINQNKANANGVKIQTYENTIKAFSIKPPNGNDNFVVYGDGKTYIGKGRPKVGGAAANAMLSVDGLILAREVKIAIANTHWADYVFNSNYNLKPLNEVEAYITKHSHLPEVPSATEVETNGVDVVEMQATLLKKIEELTLYLLQENKRITKLEKENAELKQQLKK